MTIFPKNKILLFFFWVFNYKDHFHIIGHTFTTLNKALAAKEKVAKLSLNKQKGIKKLLKRLLELSNLTELTISSCTLSELPPDFAQLQHLKTLDLRSTNIQAIPVDLQRKLSNCTIIL